jgi:hypothetical protein
MSWYIYIYIIEYTINNILQYDVKHYTYLGDYIYYYTYKYISLTYGGISISYIRIH